jgi:predicted amidohydrolase YtcJ
MGLEEVTGSLEVGKSADLIVLERNLFETPPDEIADMLVETTYFAGRPVFQRI